MKNAEFDLSFETGISEEQIIEALRSGILRKGIENIAQNVTNSAYKIFEKLYGKLTVNAPSWNVTNKINIELLATELEKSNYTDIAKGKKDFFLIHLFANSNETLDRAASCLEGLVADTHTEILNCLVMGLKSQENPLISSKWLGKYFSFYPNSDHFMANYIFARCMLASGRKDWASIAAEKAFLAIPYDQRILSLLEKLNPNDSTILEIRRILTK